MTKKRILTMLLVIMMAVTLVPTVAFATIDNNAADYDDLVAEITAMVAAGGGEVTMTANIEIPDGESVAISDSVTLNTGDFALTVKSGGTLIVSTGGTLNVGVVGGNEAVLHIETGGTFTIGGTLNIADQSGMILSSTAITGITNGTDYLVTLDADGGTFDIPASGDPGSVAYSDIAYGYFGVDNITGSLNRTFTDPTKSGHTFAGWKSDIANDTKIYTTTELEGTQITTDTTFTAQYTANPKEYLVNISNGVNGTVVSSVNSATAGTSVTLTLTPNEGYEVESVDVRYGDTVVTTTANTDGTYSFTMPSADVTISAEFVKKKQPTITTLTVGGNTGTNDGSAAWIAAVNAARNKALQDGYTDFDTLERRGAIGYVPGSDLADVTGIQIGSMSVELGGLDLSLPYSQAVGPASVAALELKSDTGEPLFGSNEEVSLKAVVTASGGVAVFAESLTGTKSLHIMLMYPGSIIMAFTEEYTNALPYGTTPVVLTMNDGSVHEVHLVKEHEVHLVEEVPKSPKTGE